MKNKILAIISSFLLIFTLIYVPNNFLIVNAYNTTDITSNSAVHDISLDSSSNFDEFATLNRYGDTWYTPNYDVFNTNNTYQDSFVKFNAISGISFANPNTSCTIAWDFSAGDGFYLADYNMYYNGLYIDVGSNSITYDVYLVQINDFNRLDVQSIDTLIFSHDSSGSSFDFSFADFSLTHDVHMYSLNVSSMSSLTTQLSNMISISTGSYSITSRWGNNGSYLVATSYTLSQYFGHFNITESFTISTDTVPIIIDADTQSLLIGSDYMFKNGLLYYYYHECSIPASDDSITYNQLSFIYNVTQFNSYPGGNTRYYNFYLRNFYIDISLLSQFPNFSIQNLESNQVRFYDINNDTVLNKYVTNIFNDLGILKISYTTSPLNGSELFTDFIYDFNNSQWLNGYDATKLYFKVNGSPFKTSNSVSDTSSCLLLRYFDTSPVFIKGWYTFDLEPFYSIDNSFSFDLSISFTSNYIGFTNLFVVYSNNVMNYTGGQIIYTNKDNDGNVINQLDVFNYSISPAVNKWVSLNNRQLYFDGGYIDFKTYQLMEKMGTFTFISNNVNDDEFTLRDVFWSIAEVPILTLRKAFDFEILGTNVSNFVISIITVAIVLYLLRKLF